MMTKKFNRSLAVALTFVFAAIGVAGQVDVARQTTAITYPLDELVYVQFRGTTRFPRMKGEGKMRRTPKNGTQIDLSVSKMPRPFELGAGYATYVLWAVSPDGQIDNLGEIKRRGFFEFDSKISVTTRLQTFALIVTAEPHFLVRRPSQAIMLENLSPYTPSGKSLITTRAVQYFGNASDYFRDARTPEIAEIDYQKTPGTILQAIQAVALARFAGAERDAAEELEQAEAQLKDAQDAWKAGKNEDDVDILARNAIGIAVKAEGVAVARAEARSQRNERTRQDEEVRKLEEKYSAAIRQSEDLKAELARETRARELSERDVLNLTTQIKDLRDENGKSRDELARLKIELEMVQKRVAELEKVKNELEARLAAAQNPASSEQKTQQPAEQKKPDPAPTPQTLKPKTKQSETAPAAQSSPAGQALRKFGSVAEDSTKVVVTLSEKIWTGILSDAMSAEGISAADGIAQVLMQFPEYTVVIESHTDDRGTPEGLAGLAQQRADGIAARFVQAGVAAERISSRGIGGINPIVPNTSAVNRSKNRRVHIFLIPRL